MWRRLLCAVFLLWGCEGRKPYEDVVLPKVGPDEVVVSWSVVSSDPSRETMQAALEGSRTLYVTTKAATGTMMQTRQTLGESEYARLVDSLRKLDCCSLKSTSEERSSPFEAKPELKINFGDMQCRVELWDREWAVGRARECGFAFARTHGSGFVPDPPPDKVPP